jgi:hypothetical protein
MRKDTFAGYNTGLSELFSFVKDLLKQNSFAVQSEEVRPEFFDLHAHRSGLRSIVHGAVRDVDFVIAGSSQRFQVQLRAGVWGSDLLVPTVGVTQPSSEDIKQLYSTHDLEKKLWEKIVNKIDPSLKICEQDGLTFKSEADFKLHTDMHEMLREATQAERYIRETGLMRDL